MSHQRSWLVAYCILLATFVLAAALNMLRIHGGFLTNHAADIVVPAWLYIVSRGLHEARGRHTLFQRTVGRTPEIAAVSLFVASAMTEVSQHLWPHGVFSGRFDWLDVISYAVGLAACYASDRIWTSEPTATVAQAPGPAA